MKSKNAKVLVESALMVALSFVLSLIKIFPLPLGGSITLVSMLPVCILSLRRGVRVGLAGAFVLSLLQFMLGILTDGILAWGLTPWLLCGCILLDYLGAYTVLGCAGIFRNKGKLGQCCGVSLALTFRFLCHTLSGALIFSNLSQWTFFGVLFENRPFLYSVCYNGFYMIPEWILTISVLLILLRFPAIRNLLKV